MNTLAVPCSISTTSTSISTLYKERDGDLKQIKCPFPETNNLSRDFSMSTQLFYNSTLPVPCIISTTSTSISTIYKEKDNDLKQIKCPFPEANNLSHDFSMSIQLF